MRTVQIQLLKDGTGRIRIHYFHKDDQGPAFTPAVTLRSSIGPVRAGGVKGRIACQPTLSIVTPQVTVHEVKPLVHSDDPRAVTCPECRASDLWKKAMEEEGELSVTPDSAVASAK